MIIISLAAEKGGAGKSTLAVSLAVELHRRGSKVLIGDLDPQKSALVWAEAAAENELEIPAVVGLPAKMIRRDDPPFNQFDVVILDTPGRLEKSTRIALAVSDLVVVPVSCGPFDIWSLGKTLDLLDEVHVLRPEIKIRLLANKLQRTRASQHVLKSMQEAQYPTLRTSLGLRTTFELSVLAGSAPTIYEPSSQAATEIKKLTRELLEVVNNEQAAA